MTVFSQGIPLKKQFGQHFLRDQTVVETAIKNVTLNPEISVFEIGGGDGFLTRAILKQDIKRLWVFEIDQQWAEYLVETIKDPRLEVLQTNILDVDFSILEPYKPWVLLANLPYQITFPIFNLLFKNKDLIQEGVVMVQEEVAQKLTKKGGKGYGFPALFYGYYFDLKLLTKIPPGAFFPPPKVYSRLLYFKPKKEVAQIPHEEGFWKFIKLCFAHPRRTLRNNLMQTHFDLSKISSDTLALRAQQMNIHDFLQLWQLLQ
jgi:16S rRNA (adenine1518-N6/adenine1519-N6)-dimethyltransferase